MGQYKKGFLSGTGGIGRGFGLYQDVDKSADDGQVDLKPQEGPQWEFCASRADIVIYGGACFGGKTYGLLLESCRHIDHKNYTGVIFRRTAPEITAGGGLWDTARQIYPRHEGQARENDLSYRFPTGAKIKFNHLQYDSDLEGHQGAQYGFVGFDELTNFTEKMFWFLLSRNRPAAGYNRKCYMRCTCNPEPGWVAELISWWWDQATGYPIKERSGVIRYFTRLNDRLIWVDKDWRDGRGNRAKSITFIPAKIDDNKIGMSNDPNYEANILAMDNVMQERLLYGNWLINYSGGLFDVRSIKKIAKAPPLENMKLVRYWDWAATENKDGKDPDRTAGALLGEYCGDIYILDIKKHQLLPGETMKVVMATAEADGPGVAIGWEEEKGSAGKFNSYNLAGKLLGYELHPDPVTGSKVDRAKPLASAASLGRVYMVEGSWNADFLAEIGAFPKGKRDQVDACTGAMKHLTMNKKVWPRFSAGFCEEFRLDWQNPDDTLKNYAAFVLMSDISLYYLGAMWDTVSGELWVYAGRWWQSVDEEVIAAHVIKQSGGIFTPLGNDELCGDEGEERTAGRILKDQFKHMGQKFSIRVPVMYDMYGAATYINNLFIRKKIHVRSATSRDVGGGEAAYMGEVAAHFAGWTFKEKTKEVPPDGYCEALCLIGSDVKRGEARREKEHSYREYNHPVGGLHEREEEAQTNPRDLMGIM